MRTLTFIIAVIALVLATVAFQRTGGIEDLRHQVENLSTKTRTARDQTANLLDRFERFVRGTKKTDPREKK